MNHKEVKKLKSQLETDIAEAVSGLTIKFNKETSFSVTSVGIEVVKMATIGKDDEYIVSSANVSVWL